MDAITRTKPGRSNAPRERRTTALFDIVRKGQAARKRAELHEPDACGSSAWEAKTCRMTQLCSAPTRIFAVPDDGLVTLQSSHDFATTLERLTAALESKGVRVFAQIDHAAGATSAGLELRPTTLVVFGNPVSGTPLMKAVQTAGIDLPLKALVWQDEAGETWVSYNDPLWIAKRHGLNEKAEMAARAR